MVVNSTLSCADCILNMHESERCQARRWPPCAWMPLFDEKKAPDRPGKGYESCPARRMRLEHQCLGYMIQQFEERAAAKQKHSVLWGGDEKRDTVVYILVVLLWTINSLTSLLDVQVPYLCVVICCNSF